MPPYEISDWYCVVINGTTSGTAGTETTHAHGAGTTPRCYVILPRGNGIVYESKAADQTNIYLKGSAASLPFTALVFC